MTNLGAKLSAEEVHDMVVEADQDSDGCTSSEEFEKMMKVGGGK